MLLLLLACADWKLDPATDLDGDGFSVGQGDCWDDPEGPAGLRGADIHPDAEDVPYDGVDANCDGSNDFDADGDGYTVLGQDGSGAADCNDDPRVLIQVLNGFPPVDAAQVHPGAAEVWYDGVDEDCGDGKLYVSGDISAADFDQDEDGASCATVPTEDGACDGDCDDTDARRFPRTDEQVWYDGVDDNCDGNDADQDHDGYAIVGYAYALPENVLPGDCADDPHASTTSLNGFSPVLASEIHPNASDRWYDGFDQDCGGNDDFDQDADGHPSLYFQNQSGTFGDDCFDTAEDLLAHGYVNDAGLSPDAVYTGAAEAWYDGSDQDCAGDDDFDQDHDGVSVDTDCDDADPTTFPGATEIWYDGWDQDCDGRDDDQDQDGYVVAEDCDDQNAGINIDAIEQWYNGVDENCDSNDADQDRDGSPYPADCEDLDPAISPLAAETCNAIDDNCDGLVDDGAVDAPTWYADSDGDLYGSLSALLPACTQPSGYVSDSSDCDDLHAAVNPSVAEVCDGIDGNCNGLVDDAPTDGTAFYDDADGDTFGAGTAFVACSAPSGWVDDATDCDDADATIHPGASEFCNTLDDECNGTVDDNAVDQQTFFRDQDQDGQGDAAAAVLSCTAPSSYVSSDSDCNDADPSIYAGAPEICDTLDNDCNGGIDDNPVDPSPWYADLDGDTYGTPSSSILACEAPSGHVANDSDCDDVHASIRPDASEVCDGIDNNCAGGIDEDPVDGTLYYADTDADTYGDAASGKRACSQPVGYLVDGSDCDDTDASIHPGASEVDYDRQDNDCDGIQDEIAVSTAWTVVGTTTSQNIGAEGMVLADDMNGDGTAELLIAAAADDTKATNAGALAFHDVLTRGTTFAGAYLQVVGSSSGDGFGATPQLLGDIDSDGHEEVLAGAPGSDLEGTNGGAIFVFDTNQWGSLTGIQSVAAIAEGQITSNQATFGVSAAVGDFDGDGLPDLLGGAPTYNRTVSLTGRALLYDGQDRWWTSVLTRANAVSYIYGSTSSEYLGTSMIAGDFDNDGLEDVVVCTPYRSSKKGSCYYISNGDIFSGGPATSFATATFEGGASGDSLGLSQTALATGDLNADGIADLALGAPGYDGSTVDGGAILVMCGGLWGGSYGPSTVSTLLAGDGALGTSVSIEDVTGDGRDDLLGGAPGTSKGTIYLVEGGRALPDSLPSGQYASWTGESNNSYFGASIAGYLDLDQDGTSDLAVAATQAANGSTNGVGKVYIFPGY